MPRPTFIQPQGSFQIDVPDLGTLDFRVGSGEVAFLSNFGDDRLFPDHPLATPATLEFVTRPDWLLIATVHEDTLYRFDCGTLSLEPLVYFGLHRTWERGFMYIQIEDLGERVLFPYEHGLICLNSAGRCDWIGPEDMFGTLFQRVENDLIWYEDFHGSEQAYSLEDGSRVEIKVRGDNDCRLPPTADPPHLRPWRTSH